MVAVSVVGWPRVVGPSFVALSPSIGAWVMVTVVVAVSWLTGLVAVTTAVYVPTSG